MADGFRTSRQVVTIASGETDSTEIDQTYQRVVGLTMPSAFTGTSVSFKACDASGGTFVPVYVNGALETVPVAASEYVAIDPSVFNSAYLEVVSGSAEGAERTIIVHLAEV